MKYGIMLVVGQLGWKATPDVEAGFWWKLKRHMETCDLDVVSRDGVAAMAWRISTGFTPEGHAPSGP